MAGKPVQAPEESREARPRRAAARPDSEVIARGLERLRDTLLQRLEQLDELAAEQADMLDRDSSQRESELRDRLSALEAAHARVLAETRRREQEWQEVLRQLETDRRLLAEAWDRLEQTQAQYEPRADPPERPAVASPPGGTLGPSVRSAEDEPDDIVTRAILRQFQALSNDVRRNAGGRGRR